MKSPQAAALYNDLIEESKEVEETKDVEEEKIEVPDFQVSRLNDDFRSAQAHSDGGFAPYSHQL